MVKSRSAFLQGDKVLQQEAKRLDDHFYKVAAREQNILAKWEKQMKTSHIETLENFKSDSVGHE